MFGIERFFANALPTNLSSTEKAFKEDDVTKQIAFLNNVLEENPASAEAIRADLYKRNVPVLNTSLLGLDYQHTLRQVIQYIIDESTSNPKKFSDADLEISFKISMEAGDFGVADQVDEIIKQREPPIEMQEEKRDNMFNPSKAAWSVSVEVVKPPKRITAASLSPHESSHGEGGARAKVVLQPSSQNTSPYSISTSQHSVGPHVSRLLAQRAELAAAAAKNSTNVDGITAVPNRVPVASGGHVDAEVKRRTASDKEVGIDGL